MKLNTTPQNEAVMSNVGEISEFRIRNSAKAFNILSSGLYANKIRAIIRELSTNAVDSHIAANNGNTPFDVHLPTALEPWFSVRDYGQGLDHEQVVNIYTTYFESTKTASNEFVGCLGLGSKSPFAYTDNFTVTAIKNGRKGIYTAFINEHGVPSIALMFEETTTEPNGVEVKFAVNDRNDFYKFEQEAKYVYTYFSLLPVVSNPTNFTFSKAHYETKDIIPGVHSYRNIDGTFAIMGNIAYPINVPNAETNLGDLAYLLKCKLEIHFEIGELDFQASREGLSYIPQTIDAIKTKLSAVRDALSVVLAKEADAIGNEWTRALFLVDKYERPLWRSTVTKYVADTKFELFDLSNTSLSRTKHFTFTSEELAEKYNIELGGFTRYRNEVVAKKIKTDNRAEWDATLSKNVYVDFWTIRVGSDMHFYINDTKRGALDRARNHWRVNNDAIKSKIAVYVITAADKTKPIKDKEFLKAIHNPPNVGKVSDLAVKERDNTRAKDITILKLENKQSRYWGNNGDDMVWRDAGKADKFDPTITHYYLPLSGYSLESTKYGYADTKKIYEAMKNCGINFGVATVFGVRKGDIEFIKTQKNWINLEDHLAAVLTKVDQKTIASMALRMYNDTYNRIEIRDSLLAMINADSPFHSAATAFRGVTQVPYDKHYLKFLTERYAKDNNCDPYVKASALAKTVAEEFARYPMLKMVDCVYGNEKIIADYINLIDSVTKTVD